MELYLYSSLSAISIYAINSIGRGIVNLQKFLEEIEASEILTPYTLSEKIAQSSFFDASQRSKNNPDKMKKTIFLEGITDTPFPIISKLESAKPLIYSIFLRSYIYSNQPNQPYFIEKDRNRLSEDAAPFFYLVIEFLVNVFTYILN